MRFITITIVTAMAFINSGCHNTTQPTVAHTTKGLFYYTRDSRLVSTDMTEETIDEVMVTYETTSNLRITRNDYDISRDKRYVAYVESRSTVLGAPGKPFSSRCIVVRQIETGRIVLNKPITNDVFGPLAISPNEKMLAYVETDSQTQKSQMRIMDIASGKDVISNVPAYSVSPSWSPDSKALVYVSSSGHVVIRDVRGGYSQDISKQPWTPLWSPDGHFILLGEDHLYNVEKDSFSDVGLPDKALVAVGWSPDSKEIMYIVETPFMLYHLCSWSIVSGDSRRLLPSDVSSGQYPTLWR